MTREEEALLKDLMKEYDTETVWKAVKVGYSFTILPDYALELTNLVLDSRIVNVQGKEYPLYKGATINDSKRIEFFMEEPEYPEFQIVDYVL